MRLLSVNTLRFPLVLLVLSSPLVLQAQPMPIAFTDQSAALDFQHRSSEFGGNGLAGAAWLDYDNDGWQDLFIPNGRSQPNALFRNQGDGTFVNMAPQAGVENNQGNATALAADFNNDGWTDLFLTGEQGRGRGWFQAPAVLYRNNGDGTFMDVTTFSGITGPAAHRTASAADINNDGLVDIFIAGNTSSSVQPNKVYLNNGDFSFTDISSSSGLGTRESSCASMFSDYNNDGLQDVFLASCTTEVPLDLFRNNGDNTFTKVTRQAGFIRNALYMGLCGADYDQDGDIDVFVTNYASMRTDLPHSLFRNNGDGTFTDVAATAGVAAHAFGWGCSFTDFDNDGYDDLFFTGSLDTSCFVSACGDLETIGLGRGNPGTMLFNRGDGTFQNFSDQLPINMENLYTSGVVHADYDQNGFTDVVVVAETVPPQHGRPEAPGDAILYRNEGNSNHWVTLRLQGTTSNRDAIGARVTVVAAERAQTKEIYSGSSHLSTESAWLTFGLADASHIDSVMVHWPGGEREVFSNVPINRASVLVEASGQPAPVATEDQQALPHTIRLVRNYPNPFSESTTIVFELDAPMIVSLTLYDVLGQRVAQLEEGLLEAGGHDIHIRGQNLASGLYTYRLDTPTGGYTGTLMVVR